MPTVAYSARAEQDLDQISGHIALDNRSAALRWLDEVAAIGRLLSRQPELGERMRSRRFRRLRRHVGGNYLFYYRPTATGIEVIRVVHAARDQRRLL
jgi:toxin ParE1/3/4